LTAIERAPNQVVSADQVRTVLRRVKPKVSLDSTRALLKRMTDSGLLERDNAGVYRLPNSSKRTYEPRTIRLLRLVYEAPDHEMSVRQAESALDWSQKL
jgi:predicted transcriptional regulator of viral defense system